MAGISSEDLMTKRLVAALTVSTALLAPGSAGADVPKAVQTAGKATAHGIEKAGDAVVHAAEVTASGVERGLNKADKALSRVLRKAGLPTESRDRAKR
jgi:hypothetical protein